MGAGYAAHIVMASTQWDAPEWIALAIAGAFFVWSWYGSRWRSSRARTGANHRLAA